MKNKVNSFSSTSQEVDQYQYLFDNLQNALNQKQATINNQGAYYYQVWVKDVHKTMFRHSKSHQETRFDQGRYNSDIANADRKINQCKNAVSSVQNKYNNQVAALVTQKKTDTQEYNNLKTDIAELKAQIQAACVKENQLNDSIVQANAKLLELKTLNDQAKIALDQISDLNTEVKNKHQEITAEAKTIKTEIDELKLEISKEEQEIYDQLSDVSESQLAEVIAEFFDKPEFGSQLEVIKKMNFDADYLAYLAIEKNQSNLLELAIEYGANCTTCLIKNQTILQKAITEGNDELTAQIVKSKDCENILLNAIKEDDLVTFAKIISADDSYLSKTYYGFTLLQISISGNKTVLFDKLLSLDASCVSRSSTQGESAFKLALNSGSDEIIRKLAPYIDLEQELANIISDTVLVQKALGILELPYSTLQNLLDKSVKCENEVLIKTLVDKGADLALILENAIAHHDYVALQNLIIFDPNYLEIIEQQTNIFEQLMGIINQQSPG